MLLSILLIMLCIAIKVDSYQYDTMKVDTSLDNYWMKSAMMS